MKNTHNPLYFYFLTSFCVIGLLLLSGCQNQTKQEAPTKSYTEKNAALFSAPLAVQAVPQVKLSTPALEETSDWMDFLVVKSEMDKFENFTLQDLVSHHKHLVEIFDRLNDSIPQKFITKPIEGRLTVLLTHAKILAQYIAHEGQDTAFIQDNGKTIFSAYQNLKIQLNEVFLNEQPNFEMAIDRVQDSIQRAKTENANNSSD